MGRQLHLLQMFFHTPISHTILAWADPRDQQLSGLRSFKYWQEMAKTLERGCFDGVFFADTPAARADYEGRPDAGMRYGVVWPTHDPMPLVAAMAAATEHLGFGVTLSLVGTPPYLAVRRLSTLDNLSGGRIGWNIVTGILESEFRAAGLSNTLSHDERYDYADEYMAICRALWDSPAERAFPMDAETGIFADPSLIAPVEFKGKYLSCSAVPAVLPSPQGRPVLFQAGSSGRGMRFAVEQAEVIFAIQPDRTAMKSLMARLGEATRQFGDGASPRVFFGVQPVIGTSEAEARERLSRLQARIPLEAALSRLSGTLGTDLSRFDPDVPLDALATHASQGMMAAMTAMADGRRLTLRELAARIGISAGLPQIVGTAEQVADALIDLWDDVGCHGFNIAPTVNPDSVDRFVGEVVPILQSRGVFRTSYAGRTLRENIL